jgi:hypothetical protein
MSRKPALGFEPRTPALRKPDFLADLLVHLILLLVAKWDSGTEEDWPRVEAKAVDWARWSASSPSPASAQLN